MSTALQTALAEHGEDLHGIATALRADDAETAVTKLGALLGKLASSVPVVGTLAGDAAGAAFRRSAYGRMQAALKARTSEEAREALLADLAGVVEALIGQALVQLVRVGAHRQDEVLDALGGLRDDLDDFRADFAARLAHADVTIDHQRVLDGALGVRVRPDAGRTLRIGTQEVRGAGSVGIEL